MDKCLLKDFAFGKQVLLQHSIMCNLRNVSNCQCTYVARCSNECKHIYALLHYMKNCRSVSKTSFEQQWGNPFVLQLSKSKYSKRKQCGSLFPQKINIDEEEGVHDFLIDDLRNINCAAREVLHFKSRDREEIERRALKAIEEMRRASYISDVKKRLTRATSNTRC
ncbi:hypothetical protein PV325_012535, partial [Microctonus aethiopoides]